MGSTRPTGRSNVACVRAGRAAAINTAHRAVLRTRGGGRARETFFQASVIWAGLETARARRRCATEEGRGDTRTIPALDGHVRVAGGSRWTEVLIVGARTVRTTNGIKRAVDFVARGHTGDTRSIFAAHITGTTGHLGGALIVGIATTVVSARVSSALICVGALVDSGLAAAARAQHGNGRITCGHRRTITPVARTLSAGTTQGTSRAYIQEDDIRVTVLTLGHTCTHIGAYFRTGGTLELRRAVID